jgi:hypothetical protein
MSWLLKHRKKDNKWRIYTNISGGWITDWLTEKEIKNRLAWQAKNDSKLKAIEIAMTFPAGWADKDTYKLFATSKKIFYDWQLKALELGEEKYEAEIDRKYKELFS